MAEPEDGYVSIRVEPQRVDDISDAIYTTEKDRQNRAAADKRSCEAIDALNTVAALSALRRGRQPPPAPALEAFAARFAERERRRQLAESLTGPVTHFGTWPHTNRSGVTCWLLRQRRLARRYLVTLWRALRGAESDTPTEREW